MACALLSDIFDELKARRGRSRVQCTSTPLGDMYLTCAAVLRLSNARELVLKKAIRAALTIVETVSRDSKIWGILLPASEQQQQATLVVLRSHNFARLVAAVARRFPSSLTLQGESFAAFMSLLYGSACVSDRSELWSFLETAGVPDVVLSTLRARPSGGC